MDYHADHSNSLLEYDPKVRSYLFFLRNDPDGTHQEFNFCPWCAQKLPEDLNEKWEEILKSEHFLEEPCDVEESKLPKDFQTDEWWKKRGL